MTQREGMIRLGTIDKDVAAQILDGHSQITRIAAGEWAPQSIQLYVEGAPSAPKPEAEPVAYTSRTQLDDLKKYPGHIMSMWSKGTIPPHEEVPLYAHPPKPEATEGGAHEKGIEAASKALGHEGVYISDATLNRAIDAYRAALTAKEGSTDG